MLHKVALQNCNKIQNIFLYKFCHKYIFNHKTKPNRIAHFKFINKREQNLENFNSVKSGYDLWVCIYLQS